MLLLRIGKVGQKFKIRRSLSFVRVNNQLHYKPLFIIFQVLYKERSIVREAYIDILYDSRQRRVNFTVKIACQVHVFFLQCYVTIALLLIKSRPRTLDCSME